MNKKTFLLLLGIVITSIMAAVQFLFMDAPEDPDTYTIFEPGQEVEDDGVELPSGTNSITLSLADGRNVVVRDFINNGETTPDVVNPGRHYLAGSIGYCLGDGSCPSGYETAAFAVTYSEQNNFFTIVLLEEPIGEARREAEEFLLDRTGLDKEELCALKYSVTTPYWVNFFYSSKELGFSFCTGSVALE